MLANVPSRTVGALLFVAEGVDVDVAAVVAVGATVCAIDGLEVLDLAVFLAAGFTEDSDVSAAVFAVSALVVVAPPDV